MLDMCAKAGDGVCGGKRSGKRSGTRKGPCVEGG